MLLLSVVFALIAALTLSTKPWNDKGAWYYISAFAFVFALIAALICFCVWLEHL